MKKISVYFFAFVALLMFATSCTKDNHKAGPDAPDVPKTTMPDAYVGYWMAGTFDMSTFWNYDGTRQDDATSMIAYAIKKDGSAEQFIYYDYNDGSDKQSLTYRKGTVTFDAATNTLKFCPAQGSFRTFENGTKTEGAMNAQGLFPAYAPAYPNCTFDEQNNTTYLVSTDSQNETIGFAKTSW